MWVLGPSPEKERERGCNSHFCEKLRKKPPVSHELKRKTHISLQTCCNAIVVADWVQFRLFLFGIFIFLLWFCLIHSTHDVHTIHQASRTYRYHAHTQSVVLFGLCCVVGIGSTHTHTHTPVDHQHQRRVDTRHAQENPNGREDGHTKKEDYIREIQNTNRFVSNWIKFTDRGQLPPQKTHSGQPTFKLIKYYCVLFAFFYSNYNKKIFEIWNFLLRLQWRECYL